MLKELSNTEITNMLGERLQQYRLNLNITQRELSQNSMVSLPTIQKLESGRAKNITFNNLMSIIRQLGLIENIDKLIPEQPESPYQKRHKKRIHHGNPKK
jgi:transcriptional regulator with XRE-family HTH domain